MSNSEKSLVLACCITNTKPPECVDIICLHHEVFTAGVCRTRASRAPAGKPSDVPQIIGLSTYEGSFVFTMYTQPEISFNCCIIA